PSFELFALELSPSLPLAVTPISPSVETLSELAVVATEATPLALASALVQATSETKRGNELKKRLSSSDLFDSIRKFLEEGM
ncbi:MAG: hypothetical protein N2234_06430, partial [Planctomycetota bacterium]|nr:hypothetical protein [Planctomycetota bacterium]